MWDGLYRLAAWAAFKTILTLMFVGIGNQTPGISEILDRNLDAIWLGVIAALIPAVGIIGVFTLIGQRLTGRPPQFDWVKSILIACATALVIIKAMIGGDESLFAWSIPPHMNINTYASSVFLGGWVGWMIILGAVQWAYETVMVFTAIAIWLIKRQMPKRKNEMLEWEIPR